MGRGRDKESYRGYDVGCGRGGEGGTGGTGGEARVPHGGTGRGGRHHGAHPALLPRAQTHPPAAPGGPYRLVRRDAPGPPAHDLGAPGARPHPQRHRGTRRGLRPRPQRGRVARPRRSHRGDAGPAHPEALADYFGDQATPENFAASLELGYLGTDGGEIVHISRRLLDVTAALVREGIPLADVLSAGRRVRAHTDALAELFTDLVISEDRTAEDLQRLRPLAKSVVEAELSMAMDRRLQAGGDQGPQRS